MRPPVALLAAWLLGMAMLPWILRMQTHLPQGPALDAIPATLGGWTAMPRADGDVFAAYVGGLYDDRLHRIYRNADGGDLDVEIFYCASRRPDNRLANLAHFVDCLYARFPHARTELQPLAPEAAASRFQWRDAAGEHSILYWLQSPGHTSAAPTEHLLHLYRRELALARTDGCFVKIVRHGAMRASRAQPAEDRRLAADLHAALDAWLAARR